VSTYATDPNMHAGAGYSSGAPIMVSLSRNLAEPGTVRIDLIDEAGQEIGEGIVLPADEVLDLASHLHHAGHSHPRIRCEATAPRTSLLGRVPCILRANHPGYHVDSAGGRW